MGKAKKKKRKKKRKRVGNGEMKVDPMGNVSDEEAALCAMGNGKMEVDPMGNVSGENAAAWAMNNVDKSATGEGVRASVAGAPTSEGEGAGGANDVMAVRRAEIKKQLDTIGRQLLAAIRLPGDTQASIDRLMDKQWALLCQEMALREQE